MKPSTAFIGIGSNLGDRLAYCRQAVSFLQTDSTFRLKAVSSLYETEPIDFIEQGRFYNAVFTIETTLSAFNLLVHCQQIEHRLGKKNLRPKGPRTIDLDILFFEEQMIQTDRLTLPHPEVANRAFVLLPLSEIAPDFIHPSLCLRIRSLLGQLPRAQLKGVKKIFDAGWEKNLSD